MMYSLDYLNSLSKIELADLYKSIHGIEARHQNYNTLVTALYFNVRIIKITDKELKIIERMNYINEAIKDVVNNMSIPDFNKKYKSHVHYKPDDWLMIKNLFV